MTEHSHDHSHEISHSDIELLKKSQLFKEIEALNVSVPISHLDEELEKSWAGYVAAKKDVVFHSTHMIMSVIRKHLPNARYVVIYEDHSHDAPHGHIEAILDAEMHKVEVDGDWHDLEWSNEVDELVWDIYNLSKEYFSLNGGKRRLLLGV